MDLYLNNRVIVLTEGEKNLTDNIIQILSGEGAIVVLLGKDVSEDAAQCKKAINEVILKYGRIEGLVNLQEVHSKYRDEEDNKEDFLKILQKSLSGYFMITHHILPHLKTSRGSVINISFEPEEFEQNSPSSYATNGGIIALTREWAVELLKS